MHFY
jgi:hypothetical protein